MKNMTILFNQFRALEQLPSAFLEHQFGKSPMSETIETIHAWLLLDGRIERLAVVQRSLHSLLGADMVDVRFVRDGDDLAGVVQWTRGDSENGTHVFQLFPDRAEFYWGHYGLTMKEASAQFRDRRP